MLKLGEAAWMKKMRNIPRTEQETSILKLNKEHSISNVTNPLHSYYRDSYIPGTLDLLQSLPFDKLHSVIKGIIEYVYTWSCATVKICEGHDRKYKHSMAKLDSRVKSFPIHNSVSPFGVFKFHDGVSSMFKDTKKSKKNLERGIMSSGNIEAYKMPSLLWQTMLSIGTDGVLIPNDNDSTYGNVTQTIMKACCSALEVYKALSATDVTVSKLAEIHILIKSSISHALDLFHMKQRMLKSDKGIQVFKLHALLHVTTNILLFGTMSYMDTNVFEHAHIKDGVQAFQRSSKRKRTTNKEMTYSIYKRKRIQGLKNRLDNDDSLERTSNVVLDRLLTRYNHIKANTDIEGEGDSDSDSASTEDANASTFQTIPGQGHIDLSYREVKRGKYNLVPEDINIDYLHPLLTYDAITKGLSATADDNEHGDAMKSALTTAKSRYFFRLEHGMKVTTDDDTGLSSSILFYCTNTYTYDRGFGRNRVYKKRFDSVQAQVYDADTDSEETVYRQILGIVSLNEKGSYYTKKRKLKESVTCITMFIICKDYQKFTKCRTSRKQKNHSSSFLPYDVYTYADDSNISFNDEDTNYIPACLIPLQDYEPATKFDLLTHRNGRDMKFWLFPLRYCDRSNWDDVDNVLKKADEDSLRVGDDRGNYNYILTGEQLDVRRIDRDDFDLYLLDEDEEDDEND
jgi:hypothetical protein